MLSIKYSWRVEQRTANKVQGSLTDYRFKHNLTIGNTDQQFRRADSSSY